MKLDINTPLFKSPYDLLEEENRRLIQRLIRKDEAIAYHSCGEEVKKLNRKVAKQEALIRRLIKRIRRKRSNKP